MEVTVKRIARKEKYTISHLYIDGVQIGDVIEDKDRGLKQGMSEDEIRRKKVWGETAIPAGKYEVTLKVVSNKFNQKAYYHQFCGGKLPRLKNVPGFEGILMHRGVNQNSSAGCLIVGRNTKVGQVTDSQAVFEKMYKIMKGASDKGEKIWLTIG